MDNPYNHEFRGIPIQNTWKGKNVPEKQIPGNNELF